MKYLERLLHNVYAAPMINGTRYSYSSIELFIGGQKMVLGDTLDFFISEGNRDNGRHRVTAVGPGSITCERVTA